MRTILILLLFLPCFAIATPVFMSYGCPSDIKSDEERFIESHFNSAKKVIYATVVGSEMQKNGIIDFRVKVVKSIKGNSQNQIDIKSGWEIFDITTGAHYIFFLYNENVIDYCNIVINLGRYPANLYDFAYFIENPNSLSKTEVSVLKYIVNNESAP